MKELVNGDMFARYDALLLESTIASMLNITYCPRKSCNIWHFPPILFDCQNFVWFDWIWLTISQASIRFLTTRRVIWFPVLIAISISVWCARQRTTASLLVKWRQVIQFVSIQFFIEFFRYFDWNFGLI